MNDVRTSLARRILDLARIEAGASTLEEKARVRTFDRLNAMLGALDSKTSVLLRFNAVVVAALAYIVVFRNSDPFAALGVTAKLAIQIIAHLSLAASVASCGFAFPVISVERSLLGGSAQPIDDGGLDRLGAVVARRTSLYSWAWRFAVAGGLGFAAIIVVDIVN